MPVFYKWDSIAKKPGDPIHLERSGVKNIRDLFVENENGERIPISRIDLKAGGSLLVALPAGELQDRLNDPHATAPKVEDIIASESKEEVQTDTDEEDYVEEDEDEEDE